MAHLRDIQLIEYCQGGLSDQTLAEIDAHLAVCSDCANRYQYIRETWQTLGDWQTAPIEVDLVSQVTNAIKADQQDLSAHGPYRLSDWIWPMAKVAASVGLAAVLGYTVGITVRPAATDIAAAEADPQQAVMELYLDVLSDDSSSGLTTVILSPETPDEEV